MSSKIALVMCVLVAVAAAIPAQGGPGAGGWGPPGAGGFGAAAFPGIPPWVAASPWFPQWVPCTGVGPSCLDCSTRLVCTKIGGLQRACTDPTLPYCNLGECSATPAVGCGPVPAVPAQTAV